MTEGMGTCTRHGGFVLMDGCPECLGERRQAGITPQMDEMEDGLNAEGLTLEISRQEDCFISVTETEPSRRIMGRCPYLIRKLAGDETYDICELNTKSCLIEHGHYECEIWEEYKKESDDSN